MAYKDRIKREMVVRKISQSELARRIGIKSQGVSQWFAEGKAPPLERAPEIAKALGVSEVYLLYGQELQLASNTNAPDPAAPRTSTLWQAIGRRMRDVRIACMRFDLPDVVAAALGLTPAELEEYETGRAGIPVELLMAFCGRLAVSPEYILEGNRDRLDPFLANSLPLELAE